MPNGARLMSHRECADRPRRCRSTEVELKFLCLAYLDCDLLPGPDVASRYNALAEAMTTAGVIVDSDKLGPNGR
jgi:hypothetical protein